MNKSRYLNYLTIMTLAVFSVGCAEQNLHTPSVKNISDVSLHVTQDGTVNLQKEYRYKDGNTSSVIQKISQAPTKVNAKGYEVIPNFTKMGNKSLAIKNRRQNRNKQIKISGKRVKVSVEAIPLNEFIDLMFANVLKLNYTVDKDVATLKTPVTLSMTNLQSKKSVYDVVKEILSLNGVGVKNKAGTLFLYKKDNKSVVNSIENISIGYGRKISSKIPDDKMILQFVPYYYISGRQVQSIIGQIGIQSVKVTYTYKGMQILKGYARDIRKVLSIAKLIDRPYLEGKRLYLVNLQTIEVSKFIDDMRKIFKLNGIPVAATPAKSGIVMSPITELNSLLVVSPKKEWIDMLLFWKKKLDVESQMSPIPKFYTYKVKNRKADELAKALNSVVDIKLANIEEKLTQKSKRNKNKTNKNKTTVAKSNHSIKYDLATNTLMMQMLPSEYREILPLIEQLDALPKQVLVEVTLAEVTLTNDFSLGFEYALRNNAAAKAAGNSLTNALITSTVSGSGITASYLSKNIDATINAYAGKKLLNILSKPRILILNNETGNINVGTKVPIITSETSAADLSSGTQPTIVRNVKYTTTGVVVGLSPTINSNGILTMKVKLNLSEAQLNDTSGIDSPLIVTRDLSTTLTLKSGQTVLLGGLISKNNSTTDKGVPLLMDIPWIGSLFKSHSKSVVKTELIMLISPTIMKSTTELSEKTRKYRKLLELLDKYSLL